MFKKIVFSVLGFILAFFGYLSFSLYKNQENILFQSTSLDKTFEFTSKYDLEELYFDGVSGGQIHAILYTTKDPKGVVIYFHGRGGNLHDWTETSYEFLDRKYNVLTMDYRSFGKSEGHLSEKNLLSDAELIYNHAKTLFDPKNIILYGRSLGSGIATYIASKHPSKMLLLEAPYFSILHQAAETFPYLPKILLNYLIKYPLRTDLWIQKVKVPIELFHGTDDELISYNSSLRLIDLLKHRKKVKLTSIAKGTHNNLGTSKEYQDRLDYILSK